MIFSFGLCQNIPINYKNVFPLQVSLSLLTYNLLKRTNSRTENVHKEKILKFEVSIKDWKLSL